MDTQIMKCPYCGKAMEDGVIQSPHEINWQRRKHLLNRAFMHEGAVKLSGLSLLRGSAVRAWLCRDCRRVIIDYSGAGADKNA